MRGLRTKVLIVGVSDLFESDLLKLHGLVYRKLGQETEFNDLDYAESAAIIFDLSFGKTKYPAY